MSTTLTAPEQALRDMVLYQLALDPLVDATMIGVTNRDGVVTLSGYVDTYSARLAAERTTWRILGVKAVANELAVKLAEERIDPDLAKDALHALAHMIGAPRRITVTVRDGHISLGGTVEWHYERLSVERAVRCLRGVRGVFNNIVVKPAVSETDVQHRTVQTLHRHADNDGPFIHIVAEETPSAC